jgi:hypothetical protein
MISGGFGLKLIQIEEERNVHSSKILALVAVGLALGISDCAVVEAARSAEVGKQKSFEQRVETASSYP